MTTDGTARKKPRLWPGIVVLVVGVLCGVVGLVTLLSGVRVGEFAHETVSHAPTSVTLACSPGDYYVYQYVGPAVQSGGAGWSSSARGATTLLPSEVRVMDPGGSVVATWAGGSNETVTRGESVYQGAVGFHISSAGQCRVRIAGVYPSGVVVGPTLGSLLAGALVAIALMGTGGLVFLAGLIVLVIAIVRRVQFGHEVAAQAFGGYPPGYPVYPGYPGYPPAAVPGQYYQPPGGSGGPGDVGGLPGSTAAE